MNAIRQVQALNKRELENATPPSASWHADYRDTAYIYIGSLPYTLSEGDILTIFSQFGEPVHLNLVRDKDTGKSRGFAFLKYEDQRSTDLAVDNLGGATVMGRVVSVDHVRYKRREGEGEEDNVRPGVVEGVVGGVEGQGRVEDRDGGEGEGRKRRKLVKGEEDSEEEKKVLRRPMLEEEKELERLIRDHDEEDPMKEYLIQEKKEEVAKAIERMERKGKSSASSRRRDDDEGGERSHRHHRHKHHHRRRHGGERSPSRERERRSHRHRSRSRSKERHHRERERRDRDK
ncbi:hypothetical protein FQN54_007075 [Arachnomyces sp. PD_36]|nr:hypothetical protein FQN54_007075 [Arachnomyces sp. PD_36]